MRLGIGWDVPDLRFAGYLTVQDNNEDGNVYVITT
jgi:hypothetical protein